MFSEAYHDILDPHDNYDNHIIKRDKVFEEYKLYNENEVDSFLIENLELSGLLLEASMKLKAIFPDGTKLYMEKYNFIEEDHEILNIKIVNSDLPLKKKRSLLNGFDDEWWLDNVHRSNQKLNFDV